MPDTDGKAAGLPLAGVRVVDLTRVFAGPQCTMALADLGADVLKVEHHIRGDDTRDWGMKVGGSNTNYFNAVNRNKRSIALNLDTDRGLGILHELIAGADVLVHNFKRSDEPKFRLARDDLRRANPRLVSCIIAGYPSWTPERDRPGYDVVVQAESGLMQINGGSGQPPTKVVVALVDQITGMLAAQSVLAALYRRQSSGEGAHLEQTLFDSGTVVTGSYALDAIRLGRDPARYGNDHASIVPYGMFDARDGRVIIAAGNTGLYRRLCLEVLDSPELWNEPAYQTNQGRMQHRDTLVPLLNGLTARYARSELLERLQRVGIPCGEVAGIHEAITSRRASESGSVQSFPTPAGSSFAVLSPPYIVEGRRLPIRRPPPSLGQHGREALAQCLGLDATQIDRLVDDGVLIDPGVNH